CEGWGWVGGSGHSCRCATTARTLARDRHGAAGTNACAGAELLWSALRNSSRGRFFSRRSAKFITNGMRITIVLGAFFPVPPILGGAVEKVWFAIGQEFVRQGHEVVQISRAHPALPEKETIAGVLHLRIRGYAQPSSIVWLKWLDLLYSLRVRRGLPPAEILVTNTFWLPILVRQKDRGLVYVHVQRGPKGQMRFYAHAGRLCAVSQAIADQIVNEAPQLREKVRLLPNALPFQVDRSPYRARGRTILFVGRVHPEKGIELLLK